MGQWRYGAATLGEAMVMLFEEGNLEMEKNQMRLLLGTGVLAAGLTAAGAVSHGVTRQLVRIAVDRELPGRISPRARRRFKGSGENAAFLRALEEGGRRLASRNCKTVEILARDGTRLVGHWLPCKEPKRVVVAMHGWRSSWNGDFGLIADFLCDSGCSVLYAEQRGQGSSGGKYMGLGALERLDCVDWARWAEKQAAGLPIYLAGVSMGATTVLMAAGVGLPDSVHGILADCGFTSPQDIGRHILEKNLHLSSDRRISTADSMCRRKNAMGICGCSAVEAVRKNKLPVLFVHGAKDSFVPVSMTYENYNACAAPKELLIVPEADHGMSYYLEPERYQEAVRAFWNKYDRHR